MNKSPRCTKLCILAASFSALAPLITLGVLLSPNLSSTKSLGNLIYLVLGVGVAFVPIQFMMLSESKKYASQLEKDTNTTPTRTFQFINGTFYGILFSLICMAVILSWIYLAM